MTKNTGRGPADAANNGKHVPPENSSRCYSRGGRIIDEAHRGVGGEMHIGGGRKSLGEPTLDQQRDKEERAKDLKDQVAGGYLSNVRRGR